ncbi:MAG: hypothetical protein SZ59_C0003G0013 [candidate division TM6 bacterium GW2011_GWF2_28_16]|nr:MAG: hypothetical protein SZ59_C0003G0013 [candidate division TM6 bacterium GW2011_GWF2_28_16]
MNIFAKFLFSFFLCVFSLNAQKNGTFTKDGNLYYHHNGITYPTMREYLVFGPHSKDSIIDAYLIYLEDGIVIIKDICSSEIDPSSFSNKNILGSWNKNTKKPIEGIGNSSVGSTSDSTSSGGQSTGSTSDFTSSDVQGNTGSSDSKLEGSSGKGSGNGSSKGDYSKNQAEIERVTALAHALPSSNLDPFEQKQANNIVSNVKIETIEKVNDVRNLTQIAFKTKNPKDILDAIKANNNTIDYVEGYENKLAQLSTGAYIKTRPSKREAVPEYTTHDGKTFKNKKIKFGNKLKKWAYKIAQKKNKLKKEKFQNQLAVADGLKHENELLYELLDEQTQKINNQDTIDINQKNSNINSDDLNNLINSLLENQSTVSDKDIDGNDINGDEQPEVVQENQVDEVLKIANENQEEINNQIDEKQDIDNDIVVDNTIPDNYTNSIITPYIVDNLPKDSGFVKNTTRDMLKFGKSCAIKNPELTRAAVKVINGAIQGIINDETLIPKIKDTIKETKKSLKAKDLVSDFDRDNFNSTIDKPSKHNLNKKAKTKFKKLVEQKITDKKIELGDFYEECTNLSIFKKDNPVIYFSNKYSLQACEAVKLGLDIADEYLIENELELANTFTDTSSSLLKAAKETANFVKLFGQSAIKSLSKYKNPVKVVKDFGHGFVDLARSLGCTTLKIIKVRALAITEPELAGAKIQDYCDHLSNKCNEIKNNFSNLSHEKKVTLIAETLADFVVDGVVSGGVFKTSSKAVSFFEKLSELTKKEQAVAKLVAKSAKSKVSYIKTIATPLSNAIMETSELVEIAGIYGQKITRASLNVVAKDRNIIRSEKTIAGAVNKVIKRTEKSQKDFINLVSEERTQHIIFGEKIKKDRFGGGHKFPGNPKKTSFPKSWSEEKIMHEISDIATDPSLQWIPSKIKDRFTVVGTRDGIKIKVIIESGEEGIISGFPIEYGGEGVTCRYI